MRVRVGGSDIPQTAAPLIYAEIGARSITPTTFEYIEYTTDLSNPVYIERYRAPSMVLSHLLKPISKGGKLPAQEFTKICYATPYFL